MFEKGDFIKDAAKGILYMVAQLPRKNKLLMSSGEPYYLLRDSDRNNWAVGISEVEDGSYIVAAHES